MRLERGEAVRFVMKVPMNMQALCKAYYNLRNNQINNTVN